ncbi:hypothetical protein CCH79_00001338 [Gambusia affinis]|uniref:Uncharacterized protein n=1 Tax=Gambusia affinis TaxID=33528 RepID=A0A315VR79_GAMAF|nr:hypothetical protein CCH79_00001338 [Gambusia affinis]
MEVRFIWDFGDAVFSVLQGAGDGARALHCLPDARSSSATRTQTDAAGAAGSPPPVMAGRTEPTGTKGEPGENRGRTGGSLQLSASKRNFLLNPSK